MGGFKLFCGFCLNLDKEEKYMSIGIHFSVALQISVNSNRYFE